jgi:tRNA dimethylallyltransferase
MVDEGALDEVRALLALGIDPALPVMKALGVAQLAAFIQGDKVLEDVVDEARQLSRNYAKRQLTWVRNQIHADYVLSAQYSKSFCEEILSFIHQFLLTNPV